MRKLKITLEYNKFYYILLLIILIITCIRINIPYKSVIDINKPFIGKIVDIQIKEDKKVLTIKNKDKIIVYLKNNNNNKLGDIVKVTGKYEIPNKNTIESEFNYQKYLYNHDTYYLMYNPEFEVLKKNTSIRYKIKEFIINRCEEYQNNSYLKAFIIGDKTGLDSYSLYQKNGISHLFAISGMHIGFISFFILFILKKSKYKYTITMLILFFYTMLTNLSASIVRSLLFFFLIMLKNKYDINTSNQNILLLTISILLLINPFYIYDIGFLYSIVVTFGLLFSSKYYKKNYFINLIITSVIATLFSLPITLYNNYELNLLCIINNVINVPLVSFIIYPLSMIVFIFKPLEPIYNISILLLELINIIFDKLSFNIVIPKLSILIIIIYYVLLTLFILSNNKKYLLYIFLVLFIFKYSTIYLRSNELIFIDVKQGDSILSIINNKSLLIDTGGSLKNYYSKSIINLFKSKGLNKVDYLILSHGDFDHMGEAINLVENFTVEKVIFNCGEFNDLEKDLINVLDKKKIPYYSCIKELNMDDNKLYFLNNKDYGNENDNSSVIYTELNNHKFLFMGDAGVEVEEDLIEKYNLKDVNVLKVGHHGSKTSSGKEFIDEVNPKYSIISVGKNNRYGHPNDSVLNNLEDSKIYRTDQDGSIRFKIKNSKLKIETCSP